ncbi:MAG: WYL domain-containing protein [Oscillospiraceae bacterium]|nr:WYL domain-containing protein [Oscillospiraceae bacterium]
METEKSTKFKFLKLYEMLKSETDEENPMSTNEICRRMAEMGVPCNRRTLPQEIRALNDEGYEVCVRDKGRAHFYYVADRDFSVPELRLLIDAVQASHLMTEKKTQELTEKIAALAGSKQAEVIKNNIVHFNPSKCTNESIYYVIDALERALRDKKKVVIRYFHLNEKREKVYRSENGIHMVEPIALVYNNDKYYLTCYNPKAERNYNYRLDRIEKVEILDEKISKNAMIRSRSVAKYTAQVFKMYGGETEKITLQFDAQMIDYIYEKFGINTKICSADEEQFTTQVDVQISPTFFGWVLQFAGKMKIIAPQNVCDEYVAILNKAIGEQL